MQSKRPYCFVIEKQGQLSMNILKSIRILKKSIPLKSNKFHMELKQSIYLEDFKIWNEYTPNSTKSSYHFLT